MSAIRLVRKICYNDFMKKLKYVVLFGNAVYALWILYNGIDDGFRDIASVQGVLPIGLILLLILDIALLWKPE